MNTTKPDMLLWLDDRRGVYIPRDFAQSFANRDRDVTGVDAEDWAILEAGPDHEWYWEAWNNVCDHAVITIDGHPYRIHQDGDCWLVPEGMTWDERNETFTWDETVND